MRDARKARVKAEGTQRREQTSLRSKRKVRFQEEPQGEESDRLAATPSGEWRPDQMAAAEGAKR